MNVQEFYQGLRTRLSQNYGAQRRRELQDWLKKSLDEPLDVTVGIPVNCEHWPQLDEDPDLRILLKKGLLLRRREKGLSWGNMRRTYLIPPK
jgi:hypothetical protein